MPKSHRIKRVLLRADSLQIHPSVQRAVQTGWLKVLTNKLDLDAIGTIAAVQYPIAGKTGPWVIDGQHRIKAILANGCGEWEVDVHIYLDVKSDQRAAELFKELNTRRVVAPLDMYRQEVTAGDDTAVGVDDIVRKFGLVVGNQSIDGMLACPVSLKKAYNRDEGKSLVRGLSWLTGAFGKRAAGLEGKLVEGITLVASRNNGNVDDAAMVKKLAKYDGGASSLIGDAKGRMRIQHISLSKAIAAHIIDLYNSGRRAERLNPL